MTNTPASMWARRPRLLTTLAWIAALGMLSACGGGGGSSAPPAPTLTLGSNTLTFTAASAFAATPAGQTVTATINGTVSGTVYILVDFARTAVANVGSFTVNGNSGQGTVTVFAPQALETMEENARSYHHVSICSQTKEEEAGWSFQHPSALP